MNRMGIIHRVGLVVMVLTLLSVASDNSSYRLNKELNELAAVNEKLGVIEIQPLDKTIVDKKKSDLDHKLMASVLSLDSVHKKENEYKELLVDFSFDHNDELYLVKVDNNLPAEKIAEMYRASTKLVGLVEPNFEVELNGDFNPAAVSLNDLKSQFVVLASEDDNDFVPAPLTVAVVDSGIDSTHPALAGKIVEARNFVPNSDISDNVGHGTHISGIITSEAPNAQIMALKFTDGKTGNLGNLTNALSYAVRNDADVINLSLGLQEDSELLERVIKSAIKKDIVVVAAAGNQNTSEKFYPAAADGVISVAALDKTGGKLYSSNYGDWIDFSVRGQDIYSTFPHNRYKYWSGTSQAAASLTGKIVAEAASTSLEEAVYKVSSEGAMYVDGEGRQLGVKLEK